MNDLLVGVGLVFVIEGLLWGIAPTAAVKMLEAASQVPQRTLSMYGWTGVVVGLVIVWSVRG